MASNASAISGSLFGAVGSIASGNATGNALENSAQINESNAVLAEETGQYDANRSNIMAEHKIGTATAAYGANGAASDSGSVLNVLAASRANAELDRLNILHGADVKAINYRNQASIERSGASSARTAGYLNAVSSIAMGGSKVFGNSSGASSKFGGGMTDTNGEDGSVDDTGGEGDMVEEDASAGGM